MSQKYKFGDVVDLDDVFISPAAYAAWQATAQAGALALPRHIRPGDIPDERGLWLASGELEIFVELGGTRISMRVPVGHWTWKQ